MLNFITASLLLSLLSNDPRPIPFAKGTISTEDDEFGMTFTPDGKTCYFTKRTPSTLQSSTMVICVSYCKNGRWSRPEIAPFSGRYKDFNPCISPDGLKLFFISNRPVGEKKGRDTDIWMVKRSGNGWSEPENIGPPVNTTGWELGCSVAGDGTLYYSSTGTTGISHIYRSTLVNGKYQSPDTLSGAINSVYGESDPFIAPDESYILFSSQGRPDGLAGEGASARYPRSDLYISYRKNGKWAPAQNLGMPVNSTAEESSPFVSRDGKTLYFTSERNFYVTPMKTALTYPALEQGLHGTGNGLGDIYQVPVSILPSPPPDLSHAVLFGEGVISTKDDEFGGSFTPDGKTCYFSKSILRFYLDIICYSEFKDGKWQMPRVAPFSGIYRDFDPVLSPDGKKMVFTSNRPVDGKLKADYDIWMVEKKADGGWSEPIHLDTAINSPYDEHFASIASSGTIYFSSNRPGALGGEGDADFYYSRLENGHYTTAVHLLDSVSTPAYELDCLIAPDESFLLMGAYGRQDGYGNYDIYISYRKNGRWTPSRNLGPKVNSSFRDYSPRISPDGRYLFFTSEKDFSAEKKGISNYEELEKKLHSVLNGSGNIYQIELSALGIPAPGN
jgi:Tol biopolymer transport system component